MNEAGAIAPRPNKASAPKPKVMRGPIAEDSSSTGFTSAGFSSFFAGVAESFGAGGGKVIYPTLTAVAQRPTS